MSLMDFLRRHSFYFLASSLRYNGPVVLKSIGIHRVPLHSGDVLVSGSLVANNSIHIWLLKLTKPKDRLSG